MDIDLNGFKTSVSLKSVGYPTTRGLIHNYSACCSHEAGKQDYCKKCGKPLQKGEVKKGVELVAGEVAYFGEAEIKGLKVAGEDTLRIDGRIDLDELNAKTEAVKNYWLTPKKKSEKRYAMLLAGLRPTERVAGRQDRSALIGKAVIRGAEYPCAVYEQEGTLRLSALLFSADQHTNAGLKVEEIDDNTEAKMAQLVAVLPQAKVEAYTNEYQERLMVAVEAKLKGEVIAVPAVTTPKGGEMDDLERALAVAKVGGGKA